MPCSGKGMRAKLLAAITVAIFAWVAIPALSLRPYMPGAVDFERGVPGVKRISAPARAALARGAEKGEKPARWISGPVEAPHEFDLVGLAGELRHVEIRVRDEHGWTEWVEQVDATPI